MWTHRLRQLIRHFPENGMKMALETPANVRELLAMCDDPVMAGIQLDQSRLVRTTFVARDFRHVEADIVLTVPWRSPGRRAAKDTLWIYVLIEHQSTPDALMPLRLLEYVVQIFKGQVRRWEKRKRKGTPRLQPVLPIVFYTGTRAWDAVGTLADLLPHGAIVQRFTPLLNPIFLSLRALSPQRLAASGPFGSVLRLVRERQAELPQFRQLLQAVVENLEALPATERLRWLELLSYIHALVYHVRSPSERGPLLQSIEDSVQTDEHRKELLAVHETIADQLVAKGRKEGREEGRKEGALRGCRAALLRLLRTRFGDLPPKTVDAVKATTDPERINEWLDRVLTAPTLAAMHIGK